MKLRSKIILSIIMIFILVIVSEIEDKKVLAVENKPESNKRISVAYNTHVQDYGWEKDFSKINGAESGTTGQNKKIEAVKIKLLNAPAGSSIVYQSYLQGKGWQNEVKDGAISGTTGQNRKLEAIKIKLVGISNYDLEYRTHVQDIGWMDWVTEGNISGVVGKGLKVEAIEIRLIPKTEDTIILYNSHVQDIGWEETVFDGETSGTIGKGLKVEAIRIQLKNAKMPVSIRYLTHVQDYGWETLWKQDGETSGTTGQNKKVEAIRIKLDSTYYYSVTYRAYLQGIGWQDWKKDGEISGTTGQNRRLEALEIKLIEKNPTDTKFTIMYESHVQDIGWQDYALEGKTSGVVGKGLKVEAIKIAGINMPKGVSIKYLTHVQDYGWEKDWKTNGQVSGTTGQNKKVEAIKIKLEGTTEYSIAYRAYVQGSGWQEWANDGEIAGTTGKNLKLEALEVKLEPIVANKIEAELEIKENVDIVKRSIKGWVMTNIPNMSIKLFMNDKEIDKTLIERVERKDILEKVKGYGGEENNPKPGIQTEIDFTKFKVGDTVKFKLQCFDGEGNLVKEVEKSTKVIKRDEISEGIYGKSGLKVAGKGGSDLKYYRYGHGPNVMFATFAVHGFEDLWDKDGQELVTIANDMFSRLKVEDKEDDYTIADKWTVYIFPGVNMDGLTNGTTQDGPGRTTLYSSGPENKGIDLNRCWQIGNTYTEYNTDRNYNGTTGFQAYEAQALRDFLLKNKSKNGQTILVDYHGWYQQFIGDETIASYYAKQFPENDRSSLGRYGTQFIIAWARTYLGSPNKPCKSMLLELPYAHINNHQDVLNWRFSRRVVDGTLDMLRNMDV